MMNRYSIYCTPYQTKRAYKLRAQIVNVSNCGIPSNAPFFEINGCDFYIPTAEQMCGWLREKGFVAHAFASDMKVKYHGEVDIIEDGLSGAIFGDDFDTYEQAILAAIDAALDYLEKGGNNDD